MITGATWNPEIREAHRAWWRRTSIFHTCKHSVKYILIYIQQKTFPSFCALFLCTYVTYRDLYLDGFFPIFVPKIRVTFCCFHEDFPALCPHFPPSPEFARLSTHAMFCSLSTLGLQYPAAWMWRYQQRGWKIIEWRFIGLVGRWFVSLFKELIFSGSSRSFSRFFLKWDWSEIVEVQKSNFRFLKVDTILGIYG